MRHPALLRELGVRCTWRCEPGAIPSQGQSSTRPRPRRAPHLAQGVDVLQARLVLLVRLLVIRGPHCGRPGRWRRRQRRRRRMHHLHAMRGALEVRRRHRRHGRHRWRVGGVHRPARHVHGGSGCQGTLPRYQGLHVWTAGETGAGIGGRSTRPCAAIPHSLLREGQPVAHAAPSTSPPGMLVAAHVIRRHALGRMGPPALHIHQTSRRVHPRGVGCRPPAAALRPAAILPRAAGRRRPAVQAHVRGPCALSRWRGGAGRRGREEWQRGGHGERACPPSQHPPRAIRATTPHPGRPCSPLHGAAAFHRRGVPGVPPPVGVPVRRGRAAVATPGGAVPRRGRTPGRGTVPPPRRRGPVPGWRGSVPVCRGPVPVCGGPVPDRRRGPLTRRPRPRPRQGLGGGPAALDPGAVLVAPPRRGPSGPLRLRLPSPLRRVAVRGGPAGIRPLPGIRRRRLNTRLPHAAGRRRAAAGPGLGGAGGPGHGAGIDVDGGAAG